MLMKTSHSRLDWLLLVVLILLYSGLSMAAEMPVVELLPEATVSTSSIYLQDVAQITGEPELRAKLDQISLGAAALSGSSRRLTVGQIEVRLRQNGIDPRDLTITGATEVQVTTVTKTNAPVTEVDNAQPSEAVRSTTAVAAEQSYQVVVPVRHISRHELINEADLQVETRSGRVIPSDLAQIEDLIGKRATRLLPESVPITRSGAEVPPVIDRGASITIIAQVGSVQVRTTGIAKEAGGLDEIIAVENVNSRQVVYGQIIDPESVVVKTGGGSGR